MSRSLVRRFSVSVPSELLKEFDDVIRATGYDRSKAIQVAMRNLLTEYRWTHEPTGIGAGAVITIYDHDVPGLEEALTDIQHSHREVVNSSMHVHLDARHCLEIIAVKGEMKAIQNLARELMGRRGVEQLKVATVTA